MTYSFSSIYINKRIVLFSDIVNEKVTPYSIFESSTFSFIKAWFSNQQLFTLYTSGSTGTPKAIQVSRAQLEASALATIRALELREKSTSLVCLPTQYVAGTMMLVRSFVGNLYIVAVEPSSNPLYILDYVTPVNFCALIPYQIQSIINTYGTEVFNKIDTIIIGGAPLPYSVKEKMKTLTSSVYLTYGMTETLSHIALQKISTAQVNDLFTALPSVRLSQDERNCLVIETSFTSEKIITNDVVDLLSPISFRWVGRWDNVINSGGIKMHPEKIEEKIKPVLEHNGINNNFFIYGIPHENLGQKVVLFIEGENIDKTFILAVFQHTLPRYEIPKEIYVVSTFIKSETGKIKRAETVQQANL